MAPFSFLGEKGPGSIKCGSGATIGGGGSSGGSGSSGSVAGGGGSDGAANSVDENNAAAQRVLAEYYPGGISSGASNQGAGVASNTYVNSIDGDDSTYGVTFSGGGGPLLMTSMGMLPRLMTKAAAEALANRLAANAAAKAAAKSVTTQFERKIESQMAKRGWTKDTINKTIENPKTTVQTRDTRWGSNGTRRDDPATVYIREDGHYVVRNDIDGSIVQISNLNKADWVSPF